MTKKSRILKVVERAIRISVDTNNSKRPPRCLGFLHQPIRPIHSKII